MVFKKLVGEHNDLVFHLHEAVRLVREKIQKWKLKTEAEDAWVGIEAPTLPIMQLQ